jgi:protein-S-isoprenylcysteine O-methyltransferase Ste14
MAVLALGLLVLWLMIVAGVRGYLQVRQTGEVGLAFRDATGSAQWWSRVVSSVGVVFAFAAPIGELGGLPALSWLDTGIVDAIGVAVVFAGIGATVAAQWAMGGSWRGDVDPDVRTPLVTTGPFRLVRNPILTATVVTAVGIALIVPNILAAVMLALFVLSLQIQVRLVEEPYLLRVHGDAYRRYGQATGRFVPWLGRFRRQR